MIAKKGEAEIIFKTAKQCKKAFEIFKDFNKNVLKHYKTINPEFFGTIVTDLFELKISEKKALSFQLYSSRSQNFDWQCEYVIHFLKEVGGVEEMSLDCWQESQNFYFSEEAGDKINDYVPNLKD